MSKIVSVIAVSIMLTGCGTLNVIESANLVRGVAGLSKAGVTEELIVATKDAVDPTRGGGFGN